MITKHSEKFVKLIKGVYRVTRFCLGFKWGTYVLIVCKHKLIPNRIMDN